MFMKETNLFSLAVLLGFVAINGEQQFLFTRFWLANWRWTWIRWIWIKKNRILFTNWSLQIIFRRRVIYDDLINAIIVSLSKVECQLLNTETFNNNLTNILSEIVCSFLFFGLINQMHVFERCCSVDFIAKYPINRYNPRYEITLYRWTYT